MLRSLVGSEMCIRDRYGRGLWTTPFFKVTSLVASFSCYRGYDIYRSLTPRLLQNFKCLSTTQYLHNVNVTGLHFHAINMTELINLQTNKFGHVVLLTNYCEASDIIESVMHIHEHSCTPHMCDECLHCDTCTPYMCDECLHYDTCTPYMYVVQVYGIHVS